MTPGQFRDEAALRAMVALIYKAPSFPGPITIAYQAWETANELYRHRQDSISREHRPVQTPPPPPDDICRPPGFGQGSEDIRPSDSP